MEEAEEASTPEPDVMVQVMKGKNGYGIYFTQSSSTIIVTKLDKGSEAEKAGVQPGDRLLRVQDLDKLLPPADPGGEIILTAQNYQQTLDYVRKMNRCKFFFLSQSAAF
ncbi:hypothetical protein AB1Y20_002970 [Prymnesium parvum]|uniref:PDZ domain-containing protein n=1 Tax=Prymnesium parvum TaxID=97485 RepID=A0AB34JC96_PRYPA